MTLIEAKNIEKFYGSYHALRDISLNVNDGEFLALVGPSGCGKTTLLKILAGFESQTSGHLAIENRSMDGIPPSKRPTRMVFQKLALFPHKTVFENIAFPLRIAGEESETIGEKVHEMLDLMHLKSVYLNRFPMQLSGGEQQRVALARAMVSSPSVLLLDEPLSALDVKLKKSLQAELKRLHRTVGTTFVHVTHDLEEAMMLADRICVMKEGKILQIGTPDEIYYRPTSKFVSGFIGETNLFACEINTKGKSLSINCPVIDGSITFGPNTPRSEELSDGPALLMVRPEKIEFVNGSSSKHSCLVLGIVEDFFNKGATIQYRIRAAATNQLIVAELTGSPSGHREIGEEVQLHFKAADVFLMKADEDARS